MNGDGFGAIVDTVDEFVKRIRNGVRGVGDGTFRVAIAVGLVVVNGFVALETGPGALGLEEVEHLYEAVVADGAFAFYRCGIEFITDVTDGLDALLPHVRVPLFYSSIDFRLGHFAHRYYVHQKGKQRFSGLTFANHMAQFQVAVGVDEAGDEDTFVF